MATNTQQACLGAFDAADVDPESEPDPDLEPPGRCQAITITRGERCRRPSVRGYNYCGLHLREFLSETD